MAMHQMLKCDLIPLDQINQFTWGDLNTNENNRLFAGNNVPCRHEVNTPEITAINNDPYISANGYYGYSPINLHAAIVNNSVQGDCDMETASTNEGMENDFGTYPNCGAGMALANNSQQQFINMNGSSASSHCCSRNLGRRKRNYSGVVSYPVKKIRSDDAPSIMIDREKSNMGASSSCSRSDTYPRCIMGHYI